MKGILAVAVLFSVLIIGGCEGTTSGQGAPKDGSANSTAVESLGEQVSVSGGTFTRLSPEELSTMKKEDDFPLINVHIPFAGNIPGTDTSIPYNEIEQNLDDLPADKNAKIILYCQGGPMSYDAAKTLVSLGYTNVSDLDGGMEAWEKAGFDLKGTLK